MHWKIIQVIYYQITISLRVVMGAVTQSAREAIFPSVQRSHVWYAHIQNLNLKLIVQIRELVDVPRARAMSAPTLCACVVFAMKQVIACPSALSAHLHSYSITNNLWVDVFCPVESASVDKTRAGVYVCTYIYVHKVRVRVQLRHQDHRAAKSSLAQQFRPKNSSGRRQPGQY